MGICNCPYSSLCYKEMQEESFNYRIERGLSCEYCRFFELEVINQTIKDIEYERTKGRVWNVLPNLGVGLPHRNF